MSFPWICPVIVKGGVDGGLYLGDKHVGTPMPPSGVGRLTAFGHGPWMQSSTIVPRSASPRHGAWSMEKTDQAAVTFRRHPGVKE
jgi:hypothetical protein